MLGLSIERFFVTHIRWIANWRSIAIDLLNGAAIAIHRSKLLIESESRLLACRALQGRRHHHYYYHSCSRTEWRQTTRVERREFQLCTSSEEECMTGRDTLALHSLLLSYRLLVLSLLHEEECRTERGTLASYSLLLSYCFARDLLCCSCMKDFRWIICTLWKLAARGKLLALISLVRLSLFTRHCDNPFRARKRHANSRS